MRKFYAWESRPINLSKVSDEGYIDEVFDATKEQSIKTMLLDTSYYKISTKRDAKNKPFPSSKKTCLLTGSPIDYRKYMGTIVRWGNDKNKKDFLRLANEISKKENLDRGCIDECTEQKATISCALPVTLDSGRHIIAFFGT